MTNENKRILLKLLTEWFDEKDLNKRNTFNGNPIGKLIREKLDEVRRWCNRPRGLPQVENLKKKTPPNKAIIDLINKYIPPEQKKIDPNKFEKCKCGGTLYTDKNDNIICMNHRCNLKQWKPNEEAF